MDIRDERLTDAIENALSEQLERMWEGTLVLGIMDDYKACLANVNKSQMERSGAETIIKLLHRVLKNWDIALVDRYMIVSGALNAYLGLITEQESAAEAAPHRSCATCARVDGEKMCYVSSTDMNCTNWRAK